MKKIYSIAAGGMLLFGMTLASCSNEDFNVETGNYVSVPVSTYITVPTAEDTRTTLDEVNGNLAWQWEEGDKVVALDDEGNNIGYLTAGEPEKSGIRAPFTGNLNFKEGAKTEKISLFYLGKGVSTSSLQSKGKLVIDLQNQDGLFSSLVTRDVLSTPLNGAGKLDVVINPNYTVIPDFELDHLTAAGHFQLQLKDGTTLNNVDVTISKGEGGNFTAKKTINLVGFGSSQSANNKIATRTSSNGDFYLTLLPYNPISMKFVTNYNGKEYTGYLGNDANFSFALKAGQYLRSNSNNFGPLVIVMETDEEEVDHSKNPLLKWAEADLVYNKSTKTSSIASSYTIQGSLYQWGRNVGFSNYKDALGNFNKNAPGHEYATYGTWYKDGTGLTSGYDHTSVYAYDAAGDLDGTTIYYMDPMGTDYWVSSFGNGGSNWNERAKKCFFTTDIAPEGYRMPTSEDFKELQPSKTFKGSNGLQTVLNNYVEKKSNAACSYAMRWSANTVSNKTYLRIDALVVPSNISDSELASITWDNNKNVVTRYFGANGFIHGFYHLKFIQNGTQIDRFRVGRPMPGTETHEDVLKKAGYYYTVTYDYIKDYSVNNEGYYWMSDQKMAFTFQDNTRIKNARKTNGGSNNSTYAFPSYQSVFGFMNVNAQDCCAIRVIKK